MKRALLILFLAGVALTPVAAQDAGQVTKRVDTLEKQMKAVQRKVFPGGDARYFEPEIAPATAPSAVVGTPATSPVADLSVRVDALERQLAIMTGQLEQNTHRIRQLEDGMKAMQPAVAGAPVISAPTAPIVGAATAGTPAKPAAPAVVGDPIEQEYRNAYALVDQKRYPDAVTALKAFAAKHPKHKRASYARHWLGRTYLADGKPALAVETFYANYQDNPRGDNAPDSLYWLGQTLVQMKKPSEACRVYGELNDVYGKTMSATLKDQATKARAAAKCA